MTDDQDEDGPGPYLSPGTQVRYDGLGEEYGPEYGVVVHCWLNEELGGHECYVTFFGHHQPVGEPWAIPYVLRYPAFALAVLGPDHAAEPQGPPPTTSGPSLFLPGLRRWVEAEFGLGRGRGLRSVRWALERPQDQLQTRWRGDLISLSLDRATNLLTVSVHGDEEDEVTPEVVDYNAFQQFVLRVRA